MKNLLIHALKVQQKAYAPYSNFKVGCALIDNRNEIHIGCNYENSSYGASICAERNAIGTMIARGGKSIQAMVIVANIEKGCPPCGVCLQVIAEFCPAPNKVMIALANTKKIVKTLRLSDFLPHSFNASYLKSPKRSSK